MADPKRSEAMRELGRIGGRASGIARRKRSRHPAQALFPSLPKEDAERLYRSLLLSPAGSVKLAALLERQEEAELRAERDRDAGPVIVQHPPEVIAAELAALGWVVPAGSPLSAKSSLDPEVGGTIDRDAGEGVAADPPESRCVEHLDLLAAPVTPAMEPLPRYSDPAIEQIYRSRLAQGAATGDPRDVYRDPVPTKQAQPRHSPV